MTDTSQVPLPRHQTMVCDILVNNVSSFKTTIPALQSPVFLLYSTTRSYRFGPENVFQKHHITKGMDTPARIIISHGSIYHLHNVADLARVEAATS